MPIAQRDSWQTLPLGSMTPIPYHATFSQEDYATIRRGLIPVEMEDKWLVYWESESLFLHRSWTGHCVYRADFKPAGDRVEVVRATVSQDCEHYRRRTPEHEAALLDFLIRGLLLHQSIEFPISPGISSSAPPGLYQHHIAGTGFPECTLKEHQPTFLSRFKR